MKISHPILIFIILFSPRAYAKNTADNADPLVKVNVLSKQVRLLREGKLNHIELILSKDTVILDELNNETLNCSKVIFYFADGKWHAGHDSIKREAPFRYRIPDTASGGICRVKLGAEERLYPLPFAAACADDLRFYTLERLSKYSVDSGRAEYGSTYWKEQEAVLALAHVIRARYYYTKITAQHRDSDFCDLTHCQVYHGRLDGKIRLSDAWAIDYKKLKHNLFFHSRCGGRTFGLGIFGSGNESAKPPSWSGVRDWLYRTGAQLCSGRDSDWERSISADELSSLIFNDARPQNSPAVAIEYNKAGGRININSVSYPPETIRLKINRVKGWSFLKSNNYTVSEGTIKDKRYFYFKGEGLGHGVGLCQHGAASLSAMGYNRYEILEHYFPGIELEDLNQANSYSPYLSYCIFDISTGAVQKQSSGHGFLQRKAPPGSIFKLFVSMYLAKERQDIFNSYSFACSGNSGDPAMPGRCWKPHGHGIMRIQEAIPNSCNLYFASLYDKILFRDFKSFLDRLCAALGIHADLPAITTDEQWSKLLAGLDYRISFSVRDYIRVAQFLRMIVPADAVASVGITQEQMNSISQSLKDTFTKGTASGEAKPYGPVCNYAGLSRRIRQIESDMPQYEFWGKTSTVIDGTNKPLGYGLFIGGLDNTGIIVLLRKGNGHLAAKWAQALLCDEQEE